MKYFYKSCKSLILSIAFTLLACYSLLGQAKKLTFEAVTEVTDGSLTGISGIVSADGGLTYYMMADTKSEDEKTPITIPHLKLDYTSSPGIVIVDHSDLSKDITIFPTGGLTDGEAIRYDPNNDRLLLSFEGYYSEYPSEVLQPQLAYIKLANMNVEQIGLKDPFEYDPGKKQSLEPNRAIEGMCLSSAGHICFINERPLVGEEALNFNGIAKTNNYMRFTILQGDNQHVDKQYAYVPGDENGTGRSRRVSEILNVYYAGGGIDDDKFLFIESEKGGSCILYLVTKGSATDINGPISGPVTPLTKTPLIDFTQDNLLKAKLASHKVLNVESMCWGQDIGGKKALIFVTDNSEGKGRANPTQIFVYSYDPSGAPGPLQEPCPCCATPSGQAANGDLWPAKKSVAQEADNTANLEPGGKWLLKFDKDGKLLTGMPEYLRAKDIMDFDLSNIQTEDAGRVYFLMDSITRALKALCDRPAGTPAKCCYTDFKDTLSGYLSGDKIVCDGNCAEDWTIFLPGMDVIDPKSPTSKSYRYQSTKCSVYNLKINKGRKKTIEAAELNEKLTLRIISAFRKEILKSHPGINFPDDAITLVKIDTSVFLYSAEWLKNKFKVTVTRVSYSANLDLSKIQDNDGIVASDQFIISPIEKTEIQGFEPSVSITISQNGKTLAQGYLGGDSLHHFSVEQFLGWKHVKAHLNRHNNGNGYQVAFTVKAPNVRNQMIAAYLKYLKDNDINYYSYDKILPVADLAVLKGKMDKEYNNLLAYKMNESNLNCKNCTGSVILNDNICAELKDFIRQNDTSLLKIHEIICKNRPWLRATAWIAQKVVMNPFGASDTSGTAAQLKVLQTKIAFLDSLINTLSARIRAGVRDDGIEVEHYLAVSRDTQVNQLLALQKAADDLQKQAKIGAIDSFINKEKNYYSGRMLVSNDAHSIYLVRPHNALNHLQFDDNWLPFDQDRYEKTEKVHYQVYNIPAGDKLKLTNTAVAAPDDINIFQSAITAKNPTPAAGGHGIFNEFVEEKVYTKKKNKKREEKQIPPKPACDLETEIDCFINFYGEVSWLSQQTVPLYTSTAGLPGKTEHAAYTDTIVDPNSRKKCPAQVNYHINLQPPKGDTIISDTFSFHVFRKQYIQLTFGFGYVPGSVVGPTWGRSTSVYNQNTGTFSTGFLQAEDVIYGVKIFPFGINVRRWWPSGQGFAHDKHYRSLLYNHGDLMANRLYLLAAASLSQKQLFNFYFGAGYEIVPGLGVAAGWNLYNQNRYVILNGQVESAYQVPKSALFMGITIDPVVFLQIANVFGVNF